MIVLRFGLAALFLMTLPTGMPLASGALAFAIVLVGGIAAERLGLMQA
jgi:hypothetical protein